MTLQKYVEALDHGKNNRWDQAKSVLRDLDDPLSMHLADFFTHQQELEHRRDRAQASHRHEMGNLLSIAQANVEGMIDGVIPPTKERLNAIRDALKRSVGILDELRRSSRQ